MLTVIMSNLLLNPILIAIGVLYILCLKKFNVLVSLLVAALIAGSCSGLSLKHTMDLFIQGMGDNAETSLSYILLGALAAAMIQTGFSSALSQVLTRWIGNKKFLLFIILTCLSMSSQNILPIHIAFIPMVIPPLLPLMNQLKIDRRAIACILSFGLVAPYISIPAGFGLIFQKLILDNLRKSGIETTYGTNWHCFAILGVSMVIGLLIALFISYKKPRTYAPKALNTSAEKAETLTKGKCIALLSAIVGTFAVQLTTHSLPLGAILGLGMLFVFKAVSRKHLDKMINDGIISMGFIAFVMLAAAGFANVLKETHSVDRLVNDLLPLLPHSKAISAALILTIGLVITLGIGSSFGTIPIIATIFVPLCVQLNYSVPEIVILIASAAALGDAGAPVSESALGPTTGLAIDGQHDHIWDTCVPTFLHYNIPLFVSALLAIMFGWV